MASIIDSLTSAQDRNLKEDQERQEKYDDLVQSQVALDVLGLAAPFGVGIGLKALNDMQIDAMEKKHPDLGPKNPYTASSRSRFSTLGQILFGRGYPSNVPTPTITTRLGDYIFGRDIPHVNTGFFNAKGQFLNTGVAPFTSEGWETGGGDGPAAGQGTTNYGGRESAVGQEDRSGYA